MAHDPIRVAHAMWRLGREGGVQVAVRSLAASVDPHEIELHVVTARPSVDIDHVDEVAAVVHPMNYAGGPLGVVTRLRLMCSVASALRSIRPAVIHLHSGTVWLGVIAPLVARRSAVVLEVHDAPGSWRHGKWTDRFEGVWIAMVRGVVVCHSSSVRDEVLEHWRLRSSRVVMFPLSVDSAAFAPASSAILRDEWRASHGVGHSAVVAITVGRLVAPKRLDLAIAAVAAAREAGAEIELVVVGEGDQLSRLRDEVAARDLRSAVHFVGALPGDELADAYRSADVCCSTSAYEGFGLTLVEAMATGIPVVAMDVGGVSDVIAPGTGFLVPPGDVTSFAERLVELAADASARATMGEAARRRVEDQFTGTAMAARFATAYRDATTSRGWGAR